MHFLKEGQKIRAWVDPPPSFGQCPKENVFFQWISSLTTTYHILSTDVIHPTVSNLPGLLLQVLLAVHSVVDHQLSCTWCLVRHIESIKTLLSTTITTAYHILVNENFNWCDTSYMVFSLLLSLPSTVPSTTKQYEQKVGKWGIQEKDFQWRTKCSSHYLWVR